MSFLWYYQVRMVIQIAVIIIIIIGDELVIPTDSGQVVRQI